jgi:hypothetical protein
MIDASGITIGLADLLNDSLQLSNIRVEREEVVNYDPDVDLWVGVYKGEWTMQPKTIGVGSRTQQVQFTARIVARVFDLRSSSRCDEKLNTLVKDVIAATETDRTLGGTVSTILRYEVSYQYNEATDAGLYLQQATIRVITEIRV